MGNNPNFRRNSHVSLQNACSLQALERGALVAPPSNREALSCVTSPCQYRVNTVSIQPGESLLFHTGPQLLSRRLKAGVGDYGLGNVGCL